MWQNLLFTRGRKKTPFDVEILMVTSIYLSLILHSSTLRSMPMSNALQSLNETPLLPPLLPPIDEHTYFSNCLCTIYFNYMDLSFFFFFASLLSSYLLNWNDKKDFSLLVWWCVALVTLNLQLKLSHVGLDWDSLRTWETYSSRPEY